LKKQARKAQTRGEILEGKKDEEEAQDERMFIYITIGGILVACGI